MQGLIYDTLLWPFERLWLSALRAKVLAQARGRMLEIGIGTGLNLPHYTPRPDLVGLDPDASMLALARRRAARLSCAVQWCQASGEALPFEDGSFDWVVGTLVFCTIPDPHLAFREVMRVLRPGGRLTLLEHVRSPHPVVAHLQDRLTPTWKRLCGGCHLNREPLAIASAAGVHIERLGRQERMQITRRDRPRDLERRGYPAAGCGYRSWWWPDPCVQAGAEWCGCRCRVAAGGWRRNGERYGH
jgi:ubiquinone/menaquinone biosynthesis C-methylase UbiE